VTSRLQVSIGHRLDHRICFVGPYGVGKTTALRSVSDIPVVSTEVPTLEHPEPGSDKRTTTVGFDYGEWQLDDGMRVGLYGIPGQARFDAVWDFLLPSCDALVLWLFGDRADAAQQLQFWLDALMARSPEQGHRLAVAITRLDAQADDGLLDPYRELLRPIHPFAPVLTADPRDPGSVRTAIAMALASPGPSAAGA